MLSCIDWAERIFKPTALFATHLSQCTEGRALPLARRYRRFRDSQVEISDGGRASWQQL